MGEAALNRELWDLTGEAWQREEERANSPLLSQSLRLPMRSVPLPSALHHKVGLMALHIPGSWTRNVKIKVSQTDLYCPLDPALGVPLAFPAQPGLEAGLYSAGSPAGPSSQSRDPQRLLWGWGTPTSKACPRQE